jgi:hypothetical protein
MSETTDLVVIEKANALTVFKSADQIEEILQKVEHEVMSFVPDVTTVKGRKEIASLAYRVTGACYNCEESVDKGFFCCPECRTDYERIERAKQHRKVA